MTRLSIEPQDIIKRAREYTPVKWSRVTRSARHLYTCAALIDAILLMERDEALCRLIRKSLDVASLVGPVSIRGDAPPGSRLGSDSTTTRS